MSQTPILMYHWFRSPEVPTRSRSPQLEISQELFERQMNWLREAGYRTVSIERALHGGLEDRSIVITFDDGTLDFWEFARPILDRHGFKATLFVVSGSVGGESDWDRHLGEPPRPLMDWEQIATLQREGHEIGSHTHSHRPLTEIDDDAALDELKRSRETLEARLGRAPKLLAYPRGFYREQHKQLVRQAGYSAACAVILRWRDLFRSDVFALKRMTIKGTESMGRFKARVRLCRMVPDPQA
ncbi:MAG: polysaccharide deacetylase family protein [bacterium]|nr:polysaccharide deacetylase family protein [bacterium]